MEQSLYAHDGPLPLVEFILGQKAKPDFLKKVKIVGVQHILDTTVSMFNSLFSYGLLPSNVYILGKCYSTSASSKTKLTKKGVYVSEGSFEYDSHKSFDQIFEKNIKDLIFKFVASLNDDDETKLIIVIDDGGKCLHYFNEIYTGSIPVIGIEQTTDGINKIKDLNLLFPVISVARNPSKLIYESPMIAEAVVERIQIHLDKLGRSSKNMKCLLIGGGAIGLSIHKQLEQKMSSVDIYDLDPRKSKLYDVPLMDLLPYYDCIIGCTGQKTIDNKFYKYLKSNAILISASSSDREFDAVALRKQLNKRKSCHSNLSYKGITLVNSGFPVNFDGAEENIDPHLIQFTIALMTSAIIQACSQKIQVYKGIIPLKQSIVSVVKKQFIPLMNAIRQKSIVAA